MRQFSRGRNGVGVNLRNKLRIGVILCRVESFGPTLIVTKILLHALEKHTSRRASHGFSTCWAAMDHSNCIDRHLVIFYSDITNLPSLNIRPNPQYMIHLGTTVSLSANKPCEPQSTVTEANGSSGVQQSLETPGMVSVVVRNVLVRLEMGLPL